MKPKNRKPKMRFNFMDCPLEIQLQIMSFTDAITLRNLIQSSISLTDVFLTYPEILLQCCTSRFGAQIKNLIITTLKFVLSVKRKVALDELSEENIEKDMKDFLVTNLDSDKDLKILNSSDNALQVLDTLCALEQEMTALVSDYATDAYNRANHFDNPCAIPPPLKLSATETHRILRACWRLKLFGVIFYSYVDYFHLNLSSARQVFLSRLCDFELDEMVTIYQFMVRCRYRLSCLCTLERCRDKLPNNYGRDRDPFQCSTCRFYCQLPFFPPSEPQRRFFRCFQPFWSIVESMYLQPSISRPSGRNVDLWVNPAVTGTTPVREWEDFPENNGPNAGWEEMRKYRDDETLDDAMYVTRFRDLGFCFWDRERLLGWDFFDAWSREYENARIEW